MHYVVKCSDFEWPARDLFKVIGGGVLKANINYEYALKAAIKFMKKSSQVRHWALLFWFHDTEFLL